MKKQSFITILLTVLMSMTGAKAFAHDIAVANADGKTIYYIWANNEKTELAVSFEGSYSSWYVEYSGDVAIPESVEYESSTYKVTAIGSEAFSGCNGLTSVTIPSSVTIIGYNAFRDCNGLSSVTIPNSVISIGSEAFYGTPWLNNQPDGVVYAGKVVYKYKGTMQKNTNIELQEGTLGIASSAFNGCSGLSSIIIPNGITSIGQNAFFGCTGLSSITLPNSVESIGQNAFSNCTGLTSITIPNSVTTIGQNAFYGCI